MAAKAGCEHTAGSLTSSSFGSGLERRKEQEFRWGLCQEIAKDGFAPPQMLIEFNFRCADTLLQWEQPMHKAK